MTIQRLQTLSIILKRYTNTNDIIPILKQYQGTDWITYLYRDCNTGYHRVLLDRSTNYSLFLMTWYPRAMTNIHFHPNNCYFKVLYGSFVEHQFTPEKQYIDKYTLQRNDVGFINNSIGCHRLINNQPNDLAVSLHVYLSSQDDCQHETHTYDRQSWFQDPERR